MRIRNVVLGAALLLIMVGCGETTTPTPISGHTPQANATAPTRPQVTTPAFNFMPRRGAPGTVLNLGGANFKPNSKVVLRIGTPDPVGEALATADVDAQGKWSASLTVPATLPSGEAIVSKSAGDIMIVVMDEANNAVVSEPFAFVNPDSTPVSPGALGRDPTQPIRDFLTSLQSDPTGAQSTQFLSRRARGVVETGTPVAALLGLQSAPKSFTIKDTADTATIVGNKTSIKVTLDFESGPVDRTFNMVREFNEWRIDSVS